MSNQKSETQKLSIARLGKTVGLKGEMKIHLLTDFPQQLHRGAVFETDRGTLTIASFNPRRGTVKFEGIDNPESAKRYTNAYLYSDIEKTKSSIQLEKNEYFWFDILGCEVYEKETLLGKVKEIQRLPSCDYLEIETSSDLVAKGHAKRFLLPFLDRFIENVDIEKKRVDATGAMDILEAS